MSSQMNDSFKKQNHWVSGFMMILTLALGVAGCVIASRTTADDLMVTHLDKAGVNVTVRCDRKAVENVGLIAWTWVESGSLLISFAYFLSVILTICAMGESVGLMTFVIFLLTIIGIANLFFQFAWWIIGIINIANSKACAGTPIYIVDLCFLCAPALGIILHCLSSCCSGKQHQYEAV